MKNVVLFGAGQVGAMVSRLMGPGYWVSCFADNDEKKRGSSIAGIPICAPREALAGGPDCVCLCALDEERCGQMEARVGLSRAKTGDFAATAMDFVAQRLFFPERARFYPGYFPDTFALCSAEAFAFVSIDADLYAPTAAALPLFWERLSPGGVLMIHDVNSTQFRGPGRAIKEFCQERMLLPVPICDLHGSVLLRKA